jgi:hypothetical protein
MKAPCRAITEPKNISRLIATACSLLTNFPVGNVGRAKVVNIAHGTYVF